MSRALGRVVGLALGFFPMLATAQSQDVEIQMRERVPEGQSPGLRVVARKEIEKIAIALKRSDGVAIELSGRVAAGDIREFTWTQPPGTTRRYQGDAFVQFGGGAASRFELDFTVTMVGALRVWVGPGGFSLARRLVRLSASRPLTKAEIEVQDPAGKILGRVERAIPGPDSEGRYVAGWDQEPGEVRRVLVKGFDADGFWAGVEIVPFALFIPHDEVVFAFGKAKIRPEERPKLDATLALIRDAIAKNADVKDLRLYIAGYTDTVGGRRYNLRLSSRRAASIGRYFHRQGLGLPIFTQGFGEDVLAVQTEDNTPEEKNRRALYLLTNHTPPLSKPFPRGEWKALR
jgi:outer membrane protein OmpA-like peptidoglycan-associated protein